MPLTLGFLKERDAGHPRYRIKTEPQRILLANNRKTNVNRNGYPDLGLDDIHRIPKQGLDSWMRFDPGIPCP